MCKGGAAADASAELAIAVESLPGRYWRLGSLHGHMVFRQEKQVPQVAYGVFCINRFCYPLVATVDLP